MKSIRRYLLSRVLIGAAGILGLAGVVVYAVVARSLERHFDANLEDRIQALASILFQVEDELSFEFSGELMPEYEPPEGGAYFELRLADGTLVEASSSLGEGELELPVPAGDEATCWSAPLPDGRPGRYALQQIEVHHVYPEEGPGRPRAASVVIAVARGTQPLMATKRAVVLQVLVAFALLMAMLAALTRLAVARGLEPTLRLGRALDEVSTDHVPRDLDIGPLPEELEPMARKAGALMRRVAEALDRERRTTADIAHELRTPISEVLTVSEVALRHNGHRAGEGDALSTIRNIASHMGRSVSTLLKLAWLESGGDSFQRNGVDLASIVGEVRRALGGMSAERGLHVTGDVPAGRLVEGDPDVLRIIVSNLLSNAYTYAPAGGQVDLAFESQGGTWSLRVANQADDLRPEDLSVLTDPFWRKERARSDRKRFGLGLALSSALAEKTGLRLAFELEGQLFRATLGGDDCGAAVGDCRASAG